MLYIAFPYYKDQNNSLFIGTLDTLGVVLTPIKLTGSENYRVWSRSMRITHFWKYKHGFVIGASNKDTYRLELYKN